MMTSTMTMAGTDETQMRALIRLCWTMYSRGPLPAPKPFSTVLRTPLASQRWRRPLARVARNLTEEQLTVLAHAGATTSHIDSIAALGKGEPVESAIKLIASGMSVDAAIGIAKKAQAQQTARAASEFDPPSPSGPSPVP